MANKKFAKFAADRNKRRMPKGPKIRSGRERNVGHKKGEEHSRLRKGN